MRSCYNRTGFFIIIVYAVMAVISAVLLYASLIPVIAGKLLDGSFDPAFEKLNSGDFAGYISEFIKQFGSAMTSGSVWIVLGIVIGSALGLGLGIVVGKTVLRKLPADPPEKKTLSAGGFLFYVAGALGLWGLGVYAGNFPALFFDLRSAGDSVSELIGDNILPYLLYAVIGAPILEEITCRKIMLDRLRRFGELPAAFVTALIFGLFHGNSGQFFLAFNVGLLFAVVYLKTGRIIYTMLLHGIINFIGSTDGFLYLFGVTEIGGVPYASILYIAVAVFGVVGCTLLAVSLIRRDGKLMLKPTYCAQGNRAIFRNPGMIIVVILFSVTVISTDFMSLFMNIMVNRGLLSLTVLLPTVLFVVMLIVLLAKIGTRRTEEYVPVYTSAGESAEAAPVSGLPEAEAPAPITEQNPGGDQGSGSEE